MAVAVGAASGLSGSEWQSDDEFEYEDDVVSGGSLSPSGNFLIVASGRVLRAPNTQRQRVIAAI